MKEILILQIRLGYNFSSSIVTLLFCKKIKNVSNFSLLDCTLHNYTEVLDPGVLIVSGSVFFEDIGTGTGLNIRMQISL